IFSSIEFFTFKNAYKRLHSFIWSYYKEKTKILFSGHDLKFAKLIIDYFNKNSDYECRIDKWENHTKHDEFYSQECLEWADIIFCEWGLGNIEWYSQRKKEHQKLIVRLHFQEKDLMYLSKSKKENIDKYIVITPYMFEEFVRIFNLPKEKVIYIDNLVRKEMFATEKEDGSEFNLGIIGILPARKRLDLALDVFEKLWEKDRRYRLYVKGHLPQEVSWVMARKAEKEYYDQIMRRIYNASWREHVIFEKHGDDINIWFKKIGHLLSTSDYEGSHVSVSEAMAAATHPVIRNWKGSDTIYPKTYIHKDIEAMVQAIETFEYDVEKKNELTSFAKNKFFAEYKNKEIKNIFDELYSI
ncbi:glycosyltransferase family 4 protein, partial [Enterococcus faecalis]|nr:glycosyltransferase family 4 protein [Enterococcus faecalis]